MFNIEISRVVEKIFKISRGLLTIFKILVRSDSKKKVQLQKNILLQ